MIGQCLQVLLIEDNAADAYLIEEFLAAEGSFTFQVTCADRVSRGVEYLQERSREVVLLDLGLPDSQGLEGLARVRAAAPAASILILTGLDTEEMGLAAVQQGAQDYLVKGQFNRAFLVRAIRHARERQRLREELRQANEALESRVRDRTAALIETNAALCAREEEFRLLFEMAAVGIVRCDPRTRRFLRVNGRFCQITGYSADELAHQTTTDLTHPADRAADLARFQETLRGENAEYTTEKRYVRKDGQVIWVQVNAVILHDGAGQPVGTLGVIQEVTDRKRAEEAQRTNELQLRQFVEHTPVALAMLDTQMRYLVCSRRWRKDYHLQDGNIRGRSHYEVFPEIPPHWKQSYARALAGAVERCEEDAWPRLDGSIDAVRWQVRPWWQDRGTVGGIIIYMEVITELKRAHEQRRQLEAQIQHTQKLESLGVLAGGIAHDFNNLLTAILGNTSLALLQLSRESPVRPILLEAEKASLRAADLIQQMLAYSGKGRFVIQPLNLSRVVEEMAHLLHTVISKKAVLRFDFAADLPLIEADATQLRQVIMNLLTNASDALGDQSGIITLRTGMVEPDPHDLAPQSSHQELPPALAAEASVFLEVSDTGCGMDAATVEKIFDPFFTTKFTGRGLGLAAVQGIVRGHRGVIKIASEPGRGTTFQILFPRSALRDPDPSAVGLTASWQGHGTILVVDDEEIVRSLARKVLEGAGFRVLLANDGRAALEIFRRHQDEIRAVLLDLTMPLMNGEEAFHELRLLQPQLPVVLMSGYHEQEVTNLFAGKGIAGFVQKPFHLNDLISMLRQILHRESPPAVSLNLS